MLFDDYRLEFADRDTSPRGGISLLFGMLSKCRFEESLGSFGLP
jgi:hypothetical protein